MGQLGSEIVGWPFNSAPTAVFRNQLTCVSEIDFGNPADGIPMDSLFMVIYIKEYLRPKV